MSSLLASLSANAPVALAPAHRRHHARVEDRDDGARRQLPELRKGRVEEEEVQLPFEVDEAQHHVLALGGVVGIARGRRLVPACAVAGRGFGRDDAEDDVVALHVRGIKVGPLNLFEELCEGVELLVGKDAGERFVGHVALGEMEPGKGVECRCRLRSGRRGCLLWFGSLQES